MSKNQKGKNNSNYKHGLYCNPHYCIDCGKELSSNGKAIRCMSCSQKKRFENPINCPGYVNGKSIHIYHCYICKKEIVYQKYGSSICRDCSFEIIKNHYYCIVCGRRISRTSGKIGGGRCNSCNQKHNRKPKNHCIDCGKIIQQVSTRCKSCASKITAANNWKNSKFRNKAIKASRKATHNKQNKSEKLVDKLLKTGLPHEYKFVGDGKVIIDGFCPDFININGQKKIIEFYGDYWHSKPELRERDKRRIKSYKKSGYKTLIIWGHELKNPEQVIAKVMEFNMQEEGNG